MILFHKWIFTRNNCIHPLKIESTTSSWESNRPHPELLGHHNSTSYTHRAIIALWLHHSCTIDLSTSSSIFSLQPCGPPAARSQSHLLSALPPEIPLPRHAYLYPQPNITKGCPRPKITEVPPLKKKRRRSEAVPHAPNSRNKRSEEKRPASVTNRPAN